LSFPLSKACLRIATACKTFVIDAKAIKEVARIPVGQVPKRIATAILAVE